MLNPRLATRYAKSIINLAIEKGLLEEIFADMQLIQQICKGNRDFVNVLKSPIIQTDTKVKVVEAITNDKVSVLTSAFIRLLIKKGRESNLPEIADAFVEQYKKHKSIYTVKLTTAIPLNDNLKSSIANQIKSTTEMQNIEMETAIKEDLIGGFVLQVGDQLVDASISYDLKQIAKQFENNDFIYKIR